MLQTMLPIFPEGVTNITPELAFKKENGDITYLNFSMPVFTHQENDLATFRMITSQFCVSGYVTQAQIAKTFGVSPISIKRAVKLYRQSGAKGFYAPRNTRGAAVLTDDILEEIQQLLFEEMTVSAIAKKLDLKANTINKATLAGRLHRTIKKKN